MCLSVVLYLYYEQTNVCCVFVAFDHYYCAIEQA